MHAILAVTACSEDFRAGTLKLRLKVNLLVSIMFNYKHDHHFPSIESMLLNF